MNEDRIEGEARKTVGTIEQAAGSAIGDESLETQGTARHALGTVQDGYGKMRQTVRGLLDDAPAAVATGRDYARRGAFMVTRVATDNTALTAAGASVAVAAVSWLVLRRRARGTKRAK
jgi:uncharacterized protein YjbJ (UPF0337 family)